MVFFFFVLHRVPFPLIVELKLYFESMLEELVLSHMECITFPLRSLAVLFEGAAPCFVLFLFLFLFFCFVLFFYPKNWKFENENASEQGQN